MEFAFVALLLFGLVFGIISYAYMMSFRQTLTQAAAEGARAGAVAPSGSAAANARTALEEALAAYDDRSGNPMTCSSTGVSCSIDAAVPCGANTCVEVSISYAYRANPLLPTFPGLGITLPQQLRYSAVAEIN